jgi:hypothetical protein
MPQVCGRSWRHAPADDGRLREGHWQLSGRRSASLMTARQARPCGARESLPASKKTGGELPAPAVLDSESKRTGRGTAEAGGSGAE